MAKLYLASKNKHKVLEIQSILGSPWTVLPCAPDVTWEESGKTFRANALIKANALGPPSEGAEILADDSGLEVELLNGAPGVYSARYAGEAASDTNNLKKLLRVLEGVPLEDRRARFVCVLCYIDAASRVHYFEGTCSGVILPEARGLDGFGYDPIFQPDGYERTFAELTAAEKNLISHRSQALAAFKKHLSSVS